MPERRISFSPSEMDLLKAVIDHALFEIDGRLSTTQTFPIDTTALRIAKTDITRIRSKIFPSVVAAVPQVKRA